MTAARFEWKALVGDLLGQRMLGGAKPSTSRIRRVEMLKRLNAILLVDRRGVSTVERKSRAVRMSHRRERLCANAEVLAS